jgi:tripartite-type tricarboxylate transporter receptor subunit TctC
MKRIHAFGVGLAAGVLLPFAAAPATADEVADFYRGKTLTMVISSGVGGGYDAYSRTLSRHMGKHIPGKPSFVNNNRVGAGGIVAANYLYNVAPQDGTVVAGINRAVPTNPLFGLTGVRYDATKFHWLGTLNNEVSVCVAWHDRAVKSMDDIFKQDLIVGAQGNTDMTTFPLMMNNMFGTKFNVISGYASGNRVNLALERGEVQGRCGWSWSSVTATRAHWLKEKKVSILVQVALSKHKELPNVPIITDFVKNERDRQAVELILARQEYGRPYMVGPDVPKARVEALRKAFMDTTKNPEFQRDIEKQKLELNPASGWDMQAMIEKLYKTPQDVVAYAVEVQKKGADKLKMIEMKLVKHMGKVTQILQKGRQIAITHDGKEVKAKVSGSRTKITVDGKSAKRGAVKPGMTCTFSYPGPGEEAKTIDCKT